MKRALIIGLALLLNLMVLLTACSSNTQDAEGAGKKGPVKITYKSLAWIPTEIEVTNEVINEWNANNPDIQVEYVQGDWGSVQQELLTSFETGDVPDIFQYWTSPIMEWKERGFLADLSPMLDPEMEGDVDTAVWDLFRSDDGKMTALPFQFETDVIFYNKKLFEEKSIELPTLENPWSYSDLRDNAIKLTDPSKEQYGLAITFLDFSSRFVNETWAIKRDLSILQKDGDQNVIKISDDYKELLKWMHDLIYVDKVVPEAAASGLDWLAGFKEGKYAIVAGIGVWARELLHNQAPDLDWGMLPALKENNSGSYGAIQTISIPEKSKHKEEAMEFLKFFWNAENQARIANAAYIFPGRKSSLDRPEFQTDEDYWNIAREGAKSLVIPEFVSVPGWGQFIEGTGKSLYQEYFTNQKSMDEFTEAVEREGTRIIQQASGQ